MGCIRLWCRFHGELNDFLVPRERGVIFEQAAGSTDTIGHMIESAGVPHTEIGRVTVNGNARPLSEGLAEGDHVEVFPHDLPVRLDGHARFVVDGHLGRLAAYLRMLGFDTWYERPAEDSMLAAVAAADRRVLLTRDIGLLKRRNVERGYWVRSSDPHQQLREVSGRFALQSWFAPFSRCMECNGPLAATPRDEIAALVPPRVRQTKTEFSRCAKCGRIYWQGSHYARMLARIEGLTGAG